MKPISIDWDRAGATVGRAARPAIPQKAATSAGIPAARRDRDPRATPTATGAWTEDFFDEGLDLVTSFVFHRDGVIVSQAPDILCLRDTDGDGVADKRETSSRASASATRTRSSATCAGASTAGSTPRRATAAAARTARRTRKGVEFGAIGNGVFRFRPDGSAIEQVSSYGGNTWGLDFAWDGELFFTMANERAPAATSSLPERVLAKGRVGKTESWKPTITDHDRVIPARRRTRTAVRADRLRRRLHRGPGCAIYDGGAWPERVQRPPLRRASRRSTWFTTTASRPTA